MKVVCLQMDMQLGCPDENFAHAGRMICDAMAEKPDVLVLPETWKLLLLKIHVIFNFLFVPFFSFSHLCNKNSLRSAT